MTSISGLEECTEIFVSARLGEALLERLPHHVSNICGESYRSGKAGRMFHTEFQKNRATHGSRLKASQLLTQCLPTQNVRGTFIPNNWC